jgi:hypothetical protein
MLHVALNSIIIGIVITWRGAEQRFIGLPTHPSVSLVQSITRCQVRSPHQPASRCHDYNKPCFSANLPNRNSSYLPTTSSTTLNSYFPLFFFLNVTCIVKIMPTGMSKAIKVHTYGVDSLGRGFEYHRRTFAFSPSSTNTRGERL